MIEHLLSKKNRQDDIATSIRNELRADMAVLRAELKAEALEAEKWKQLFYETKYSAAVANHKVDRVIAETGSKEFQDEMAELRHPDK